MPQHSGQLLAFIPSPPCGYFSLRPLDIHFYALCIIVGAVTGSILAARRWEARGGDRNDVYDALLWAIPLGIIGARLYHVITDWHLYFGATALHEPIDSLKIWEGGLGIWGGVLFGALGAGIYCHRHHLPLTALADAAAPGLILAQGIGRLGNWFNQELYGRPTTVPWALEIYERSHGVSTGQLIGTYHPTFLYEMLWDFLVVILLLVVDKKFVIGYGRLFASYVTLYCLGRFWVELMRNDPASHILGLRVNTWVSGVLFCAGLVYVLIAKRGRRSVAEIAALSARQMGDEQGRDSSSSTH
ncbi:prolipoprotein diacylglyceryl transferase [Lawsonella clevelandensis]|uniref:Phosphatidylglycerol--prolipoprotein diacylglyceryl transferase n=1 Tax=Lawsonella clevelandensis TaxID=1528099 RepID=A0A5E3ZYZ4_9ACTN|nr:prolipoprotein diacylglyceryl transferase [Lawsonella clevelandensis]VHO01676.1 Prolipoprotein diacylglyceryl transferase [Lawsonella clevelandensis]